LLTFFALFEASLMVVWHKVLMQLTDKKPHACPDWLPSGILRQWRVRLTGVF
jgi:hypothetical protein